MNLIYGIKDRPPMGQTILFAIQQLLAIMAATIAVPAIIGHGMSQTAALFGAGVGTLVYLLFTRFNSPVFLGSSFAFLGSMGAAFAGTVSLQAGYLGLILGAVFAGLVYVVLALVVKTVGVGWIKTLMPAVVIGPTVAISGNASVVTILVTAILAIVISFFGPFATFLATIPSCVMGGVCIALYGFIAVSGLKMVQKVDLNDNRNLFVVSVILIAGVGGMSLSFGSVTITEVACALILGILTNLLLGRKSK